MDLRRFATSFREFEVEQNIRYLLQNAKLLEKLELLAGTMCPGALQKSLICRYPWT